MDYDIKIIFSEEDEGYIAVIPDLPGCSAFGETAERALQELNKAKIAWLETAEIKGIPIPPPSYSAVSYSTDI